MAFTVPYAPTSIYQPNGRLVDLIRLHGEQTAEAQRRAGEIQAQMWGNLGNTIQSGVNAALKARADAPIAAMNELKVKDAQDLRAGQQTIDTALTPVTPQGPVEPGQPPLQATHPYLSDDGLVDPIKVQQLLNANGQGHLAPELLKGIDAQNAAISAYKDHQQTTATKQTVMLGSVANTTIALMKSGMSFQDAASHASSSLVATGVLPPDAVQKQIQQLASLPPDQQLAGLQQMKATAARLGPTKVLSDGAKEIDMFGDMIADNPKVEKPTEASLAATANDPTKTPTERAAAKASLDALQKPTVDARAETARHDKELERIAALTEGKAEAAQQETARHNKAMEAAANPFGGAPVGANGVAGPTGEDFIKTLPPGQAAQVKALAEGRQPFPTGMSYAKLQPLIAAVTQYDPTFDAANYTARSKARSDLTSPNGTGGKTINSLNTAIQHLGRLSDLIEAEGNFNIPLANAIVNPLRTAAGSTKVTNFNAVQPQAMKEIERLWRGAGGSEGDINALKDSLSKNAGQQQQREALQEFVNLVRGKLDSTEQQRDNILGPAGKGVPVLFEQNKSILDKIGKRASGGDAGVSVTSPSGKSYPFADQAAADRFVADAKAKGLWK